MTCGGYVITMESIIHKVKISNVQKQVSKSRVEHRTENVARELNSAQEKKRSWNVIGYSPNECGMHNTQMKFF